MTIKIADLNPSFLTEVDSEASSNLVGGSLLDNYIGVPNPSTSIVITPIGGNKGNVQSALNQAIGYAGLNGFVSEVLHGGSFSFMATQPAFFSYDQLPS